MKRLYYVTQDLDDAEEISNEVHSAGITDHHFFVISRDKSGIKTHHLHGDTSIERADLLGGRKKARIARAVFFGLCAVVGFAILTAATPSKSTPFPLMGIFAVALYFIIRLAGRSFDNYFTGLFNKHLNAGKAVIVIDVDAEQTESIQQILAAHPKADFVADCSSQGSAIPV